MKAFVHTLMMSLCLLLWIQLFQLPAYAGLPAPGSPETQSGMRILEGCLPATSWAELNIGNVRARINTGGDMWWDLQGSTKYEVPKGSNKTSLYLGALWIGGLDQNQQLKLAARQFRTRGDDYWTGPLTIDGLATIEAETCEAWDRTFVITREEVAKFIAHLDPVSGKFIPTPSYPAPPEIIRNWPWQGDVAAGQSPYMAPFYDRNKNGKYEWELGDYPYYHFQGTTSYPSLMVPSPETEMGITKGGRLADQILKGDQTIWWVFNDKGNIHSETGGAAIGLEIRAQAFAFATNTEVADATFYSYEMINRSPVTLSECWVGYFVDVDLGYSKDDYIGCDVGRGLGYCYNGTPIDGNGQSWAYGAHPPAVGIDFFAGPYMNPDGIDNPKYIWVHVIDSITGDTLASTKKQVADASINGSNFGDGIVDNERLGMTTFMTNHCDNSNQGSPVLAIEYYNYLRARWRNGTPLHYGKNGYVQNGSYGPDCRFMFPDESDPWNWGTGGLPPNGPVKWTEELAGNQPFERRFKMSAGPFTMESGGVNYLTLGVPWARASWGGPKASLELLKMVDDKLQRLFEMNFCMIEGPDAPDLIVRELDREVILLLENRKSNPNYQEGFSVYDYTIVFPDSLASQKRVDSLYRFEGYQIFQLAHGEITFDEVISGNADKARLAAQCDVKNDVKKVMNFYYDPLTEMTLPRLMVDGNNQGLFHSVQITKDLFAEGSDDRLVNHRKYYFMAIAYAYNNYHNWTSDPSVPDGLRGQKMQYLPGKKGQDGMPVKVITVIPHIPDPKAGGTSLKVCYGDSPPITRIEGHGNGGLALDLSPATIKEIMQGPPHKSLHPEYLPGRGPVDIKVVDPLMLKPGTFTLAFDTTKPVTTTTWRLYYEHEGVFDTITADKSIDVANEQVILEYGISLTFKEVYPQEQFYPPIVHNGYIESSISFANPAMEWLTGVADRDIPGPFNWIRSGNLQDGSKPDNNDYIGLDPDENFEKIVNGTWAPYRMASRYQHGPQWEKFYVLNKLENLHSVDIVFTADKSKWTRCPVIETGEDSLLSQGNAIKMHLRKAPSKDRDGNTGTPEATNNGTQLTGMSYFPGYAINIETGERLNMAFGEDSWLVGENGHDMLFNPTDKEVSNLGTTQGQVLFGGKHFLYVFGHNSDATGKVPAYDQGATIYQALRTGHQVNIRDIYADAMWVSIPLTRSGFTFSDPANIPTDATVKIRVPKFYSKFYAATVGAQQPVNANYPLYRFSTTHMVPDRGVTKVAKDALDKIHAVPNPYLRYASKDPDHTDNLVRFINLPDECTITIYDLSGTRVARIHKNSPITFVEWDMKNHAGNPVAGGMYLVHINAPGIGEKTLKWFSTFLPAKSY